MAGHPFEGFDRLVARAAAILEAEGPPASWKKQSRSWFAQQIIVANNLMLAAIEAGDAKTAAVWGIRLGNLIGKAGAPGLDPPRSAGGRARAAAKANGLYASWQRRADALWAEHPEWSRATVARAIDPAHWQRIRKVICK
jgi:hypothetical protein